MHKFPVGSLVKHKQHAVLVFRVVDELLSVPAGGASLYQCVALDNPSVVRNYHESDLESFTPAGTSPDQ